MARAGDVLHNPVTGERAVVRLGADDTGGAYTCCDLWVVPGGAVASEHLHPSMRERFTVLEGELTVLLDGEETVATAGTVVEVLPGTRHDWRNPSDREAHVLVEVWPSRRFEQLIFTVFGLAQDGRVDAKGMPSPLQAAVLAAEFDDVIRFTARPRWLQRLAIAALAPLGRARGLRASYAHHGPDATGAPHDEAPEAWRALAPTGDLAPHPVA